jgi:hypothetical protein
MMRNFAKRLALGITAATFACGAFTAHVPEARAEGVSPTVKGAIGGGLLGYEVVAMPMGIAGVRAPWAYAVFPVLGAVGGVIGGYFMDKAYNDAGPQTQAYGSAFLLAGGMVLAIPTVVVMLNATRWRPAEDATEDRPAKDYPPADPGKAGGSVITGGGSTGGTTTTPTPAPAPTNPAGGGGGGSAAPPSVPLSLIDFRDKSFSFGIPVPELRTDYTLREVRDLGVKQTTMVNLPVLKVAF